MFHINNVKEKEKHSVTIKEVKSRKDKELLQDHGRKRGGSIGLNFATEPLKEVKLVITVVSHHRGPETLRNSLFLSGWKNESLPLVFVTEVTSGWGINRTGRMSYQCFKL